MKNIDIIRGYRTFGMESLVSSNPDVKVVEGNVIGLDGSLITLTDTHIECGMAVESNKLQDQEKLSGKIPVYASNFVVKTSLHSADTFNVNDPVTVINGQPSALTDTNKIVWGYIQEVSQNGDLTIRCNY